MAAFAPQSIIRGQQLLYNVTLISSSFVLDNFVVIIKVDCTVVHQCYTDLNPFGRSVTHGEYYKNPITTSSHSSSSSLIDRSIS